MAKAKKKSHIVKAKKAAPKKSVTKPVLKKVAKPASKSAAKAKPASKTSRPVKKSSAPATKTKAPAKTAVKTAAKPTPKTNLSLKSMPAKSETLFQSYLTPLDDRIVVLVGEMEKMTPGGLFIPDTVTDVSGNFQGKVMAIGRGHMNKKGKIKPLDVSVGDKVVFSQFSGSQFDVNGGNVMIIRESDVLGIVK